MLVQPLKSIMGYEDNKFTTKSTSLGVTDFGDSQLTNAIANTSGSTEYLDSIFIAEYIYVPLLAIGYLLLSLYILDTYRIVSVDFT